MRRLPIALLTLLLATSAPVAAQERRAPGSQPPATLAGGLGAVRWTGDVPVLAINPGSVRAVAGEKNAPPLPGRITAAFAARYGRKLVFTRSLAVLAPATMVVLAENPGPPRALAAMGMTDKLRVLLSTLDVAQWAQITSPGGLGAGDLRDDQQGYWQLLVPEGMRMDRSSGKRETLSEATRAGVRLRLNRVAELHVPFEGEQEAVVAIDRFSYSPKEAQSILVPGDITDEDEEEEAAEGGDNLRRVVPARPKPSDIDYASASLRAAVSLDGAKTIGDLIQRTARATGIELYADRRVARLSVTAIGNRSSTVRSGDLLEALALAVTGTFRRVGPEGGPSAYVLTDNVVGIGTRLARLHEFNWLSFGLRDAIERAAEEKLKAVAVDRAPSIRFSPTDPIVLSDALIARAAAAIRDEPGAAGGATGRYVRVMPSELPEGARTAIAKEASRWQKFENKTLRTNAPVDVTVTLELAYVVPGMGEGQGVRIPHDETLNTTLLPRKAEAKPPESVVGESTGSRNPPFAWPAELHSRVLVAPTVDVAEAKRAVALARRFGFTELWITPPSFADPAPILAAAIAAAKEVGSNKTPLSVVAVVHALRTEKAALADRNLLGETSAVLGKRRRREMVLPGMDTWDASNATQGITPLLDPESGDWARIDTPESTQAILNRVLSAASVPGLAGIALPDTAPPGYHSPGADEWWGYGRLGIGGDFGYTPEMRLAFLRARGYDPLDLAFFYTSGGSSYRQVGISQPLPFFPEPPEERVDATDPKAGTARPVDMWRAFRHDANRQCLAGLYARVRRDYPALQLYLGERAGSPFYTGPQAYVTWEAPGELPEPAPHSGDSEAGGKSPADRFPRPKGRRALYALPAPQLSESPADLRGWLEVALRIGSGTVIQGRWDGLVLEGTHIPFAALENALEASMTSAAANGEKP